MAKQKVNRLSFDYENPPKTLNDSIFYGLTLDEEQKHFRDAIWSEDKLVVMCDARAGSGKTAISVMTADMLCKYRRYDGIVYVTAPTQEKNIGFLPGTPQEKLAVYNEPFYQAAIKADINLQTAFYDDIENQKNDTAYIRCMSHNFLRGCDYERQIFIIDEAQNFTVSDLKKVLTRVHDDCKVIVIGHTGQIDLANPRMSGFAAYLEHFSHVDWAEICHLTKNYRGEISNYADSLGNNSVWEDLR